MTQEFLPEQDAAIGRLLRAYGELEYYLGGLFISLLQLQYGPLLDDPASAESRKLEKALSATLGEYSALLNEHFRVVAGSRGETLVNDVSELIEKHTKLRNAACHGVWQRSEQDTYVILFWSRDAVKALRAKSRTAPETYEFSHAEICQIADAVGVLTLLVRNFRTDISRTIQ